MTVSQLAAPLEVNIITPGTEEGTWGPLVNENFEITRQAVIDLIAEIADKADASALTTKADLVSGKVPSSQLPSLSISNTYPAASQAAMLALAADPGDMAIRSDVGHIFGLAASPASTLGNWIQLDLAGVSSINGSLTGAVTGIATLASNNTFAGTNTFSTALTVGAATTSNHAVRLSQLESAIAGVSGGSGGIPSRYAVDLGNGSATSFGPLNHTRGTADVIVELWDTSVTPREKVIPDTVTVTSTQVTVTVSVAPATNSLRLVVI